jgi:hypothetical protein
MKKTKKVAKKIALKDLKSMHGGKPMGCSSETWAKINPAAYEKETKFA